MDPLFFLGSHQPHWLWAPEPTYPLFVSHRQLARRPTRWLRPATCDWALDSGGFTVLQKFGRWPFTPAEYVAACRRYRDEIGRVQWMAPMDWMCERAIIEGGWWGRNYFAGTHLSVREHQRLTTVNLLDLRWLAPDLPYRLVVQGDNLDAYLRHIEMYAAAGIDVTKEPLVGVGSVCRRQSTTEISTIITTLARGGLRLHGFGIHTGGLRLYGQHLTSYDTMTWSAEGRHTPALHPHPRGAKNEANCLIYATEWRDRHLSRYADHAVRRDAA